MEEIINIFKLDFPTIIIGIFVVLSAIIAIYEIIGKFSKIIGKPVKWVRDKEKDHKLLIQTFKELKDLEEHHKHDVDESIKHDENLENLINELSNKINKISISVSFMQEQQDKDKLAEYKDKIGQSYRYYCERKYSDENPMPYWNHMEKEALEGLIKQYEEHGGKNSFVHSIVEPEMQKWKVIE